MSKRRMVRRSCPGCNGGISFLRCMNPNPAKCHPKLRAPSADQCKEWCQIYLSTNTLQVQILQGTDSVNALAARVRSEERKRTLTLRLNRCTRITIDGESCQGDFPCKQTS